MIYFIKEVGTDYTKIGYTSNIDALRNIYYENPRELKLIRLIKDGNRSDKALFHEYYRDFRIRGSWYRFQKDMLSLPPDELKATVTIEKIKAKTKEQMFKSRVNKDISEALNQLLKINRLFINNKIIAEHLELLESSIYDSIDKTQLEMIASHNIKNFGTNSEYEFNKIKNISLALLSFNSITNACEHAGITVKDYIEYKHIIFGKYKYVHFDLNENEYYF